MYSLMCKLKVDHKVDNELMSTISWEERGEGKDRGTLVNRYKI